MNKITIRFPNDLDLNDNQLNYLCDLINRVYADAESDMWQPDAVRTNPTELKKLMKEKLLLIAEMNNKIVGCVNINLIDKNIAEFGMLVADPKYRGIGIGRELVKAAEEWAFENGRTIMRLELLTPKSWKHPSKEFLKDWYNRIGYVIQYTEPFEKSHPDKINKLATSCDFTVYHKKLK